MGCDMHRMFYIYEAHKGQPMDQWVLMKAYVRPSHVSRWLKKAPLTQMRVEVRDGDLDEILGSYEAEEWLRMGETIERRNMMLDNKRRHEERGAEEPRRKRQLTELRGLGKEIWAGIDAQEYVNEMRDEWDQPR